VRAVQADEVETKNTGENARKALPKLKIKLGVFEGEFLI
jgi:hypothetical protein